MNPLVSVVIVNWNGLHHLRDCLGSIRAQTFRDHEVILVDNGSEDGSVGFVREHYPAALVVENNANRGFSGGNNDGIACAKGSYLFLLNNDTVLQPDCLEHLVNQMPKMPDNCIGLFPKVLFNSEPYVINTFGTFWNYASHWRDFRVGLLDLGQFESPEPVFGSLFAALLLDKDKFREIGLFDEDFFSYGEDFDVCYRANILGHKFYTAPKAVVFHKYRASSKDESDPSWYEFFFRRNYLMVFIKNYELRNLLQYGSSILARYFLASFLRALVRRNGPRVRLFFRVAKSLISLVPDMLTKRRWIQKRRKVRDRDVWDWRSLESYNIFHYEDSIVLNRRNLMTALETSQAVMTNPWAGQEYKTSSDDRFSV